ncbi:DUF397 domain-containing protein [Streptomyces sp. NPDC056529]|uniref:DUF397 domain-containing protein n=1 Tax=Streptomyces sp. NPDC056529 TaxID=3345855 RepID=UPI00368DA449
MSTDLHWIKSSYSSEQGGNCVEVASCAHTVHVRDSKDTDIPFFAVSPTAWAAFVSGV